jgi:hypothetical protein
MMMLSVDLKKVNVRPTVSRHAPGCGSRTRTGVPLIT